MKRKIRGYRWVAGMLCALPVAAFSQQTEPLTGAERLFEDGKQLFLRHDYAAARQTLSQYVKETEAADFRDEADYMLACTAYELGLPDRIGVLKDYLSAHPDTRYANRIYSLIASACFFDGEYDEAIAWFRECRVEALPVEERDACLMRRATSYLKTGNLSEAAFDFSVLKEVSAGYRDDAVYNLAYIDYTQKKYQKALEGFLSVERNEKYAELAPYYIADIYLATGEYAKARKTAEAYLNRAEARVLSLTPDLAGALADLNELRRHRIVGYTDVSITDAEELLQAIRDERRKELCFEAHRWFDLRRYGMPSISHDFRIGTSHPMLRYTLEEKDPLYTLPIPRSVLDSNVELEQNPLTDLRGGVPIN